VSRDINILKDKIKKHMSNSFLDSQIKKPYISEDQLYILHHLFMQAPDFISKREHYIITTLLVQAALDTHDSVTPHNIEIEGEQADQSTQLTVLAGDYYSGLYYLILSNTEDIEFINILAYAIKEINELKMELYHSKIRDFSEFALLYGRISALLIKETARYIGIREDMIDEVDIIIRAMAFLGEAECSAKENRNRIYDIWLAESQEFPKNVYTVERDKYLDELMKKLSNMKMAQESEWNLLFQQAVNRYKQLEGQQLTREEG